MAQLNWANLSLIRELFNKEQGNHKRWCRVLGLVTVGPVTPVYPRPEGSRSWKGDLHLETHRTRGKEQVIGPPSAHGDKASLSSYSSQLSSYSSQLQLCFPLARPYWKPRARERVGTISPFSFPGHRAGQRAVESGRGRQREDTRPRMSMWSLMAPQMS